MHISTKTPTRIVCITEETTELLYLLGEHHRIVGITAYTCRPAQAAAEKPVVSAFISGSIKKITALQPDLVVGFSDIQADFARDLIQAGLNVLILNQRSLSEILEAMLLLGTMVNRRADTLDLIRQWQRTMESMQAETRALPRPGIFFQEWDDPIISGIRWVSELIEIVGGQDCFARLRNQQAARDRILSAADIAAARPDGIIGSWCGKPMDFDWVRKHPDWQDVPAVRNNQIYEIDSSVILQPGPALFIEGVFRLRECIDAMRT
ncbi:MAG: cobalamin-binding protein [Leptospiraceae bacterium]|nr:cobalamin-binding protein [Leptospiraceae bacterium]MCB1318009.1 cobalamin-binding protein [Leptospiraceae bacterium]